MDSCHFAEQTAGSPLNWIDANTAQSVGVKINSCTFYGTGNTLAALRIVQGIGWTISGCAFSQCDSQAIWVGADGVSYGHTISACSFDHNGNDDIYINGGQWNTITGCVFGVRKPAPLSQPTATSASSTRSAARRATTTR